MGMDFLFWGPHFLFGASAPGSPNAWGRSVVGTATVYLKKSAPSLAQSQKVLSIADRSPHCYLGGPDRALLTRDLLPQEVGQ